MSSSLGTVVYRGTTVYAACAFYILRRTASGIVALYSLYTVRARARRTVVDASRYDSGTPSPTTVARLTNYLDRRIDD